MRTQRGFTLPEVLIALLIFALIASASVYALRLGVNSRDQLSDADQELRKLQIARILMKEDFGQVVMRPVRDEFGIVNPVSFYGGQITFGRRAADDEKKLVSFVRGGWLNPQAAEPRSALQHVEYIFKDGRLIRRARIYLDPVSNSDTVERVLFENLEGADAQFLTGQFRGELEWGDVWPVSSDPSRPPRAIAITIIRKNADPLRQLFWIGDVGPRS